jgi:hypothetical protein
MARGTRAAVATVTLKRGAGQGKKEGGAPVQRRPCRGRRRGYSARGVEEDGARWLAVVRA